MLSSTTLQKIVYHLPALPSLSNLLSFAMVTTLRVSERARVCHMSARIRAGIAPSAAATEGEVFQAAQSQASLTRNEVIVIVT